MPHTPALFIRYGDLGLGLLRRSSAGVWRDCLELDEPREPADKELLLMRLGVLSISQPDREQVLRSMDEFVGTALVKGQQSRQGQ